MGTAIPHNSPVSLLRICGWAFAALALLAAAVGGAQTQTPPAAPARRVHKPAHPHQKSGVAAKPVPIAVAVPVAAVPAAPAEPEAPPFPINDKAVPATITWDSQGLRIDAANSSLEQILKDVSTATGAKVEGLDADQRIFGAFGPGPARDVLSQLLHGSGYNVVMIGDQGQGTPRTILLSSPHPGSSTPAAAPSAQESEEDTELEEQPQQQGPPTRPGFPPGMPQRMPHSMQPGQPGQPAQPQPANGPQN